MPMRFNDVTQRESSSDDRVQFPGWQLFVDPSLRALQPILILDEANLFNNSGSFVISDGNCACSRYAPCRNITLRKKKAKD